jgi:hypothetical protein
MNPELEFRAVVESYLAGSLALAEVREWLEDHVLDLYDGEGAVGAELPNLAWILLSEYDRGDRSESSVKSDLTLACAPQVRGPAIYGAGSTILTTTPATPRSCNSARETATSRTRAG